MRKMFVHCCLALLLASALTMTLLGTVALAVTVSPRDAASSSKSGSNSGTSSGDGSENNPGDNSGDGSENNPGDNSGDGSEDNSGDTSGDTSQGGSQGGSGTGSGDKSEPVSKPASIVSISVTGSVTLDPGKSTTAIRVVTDPSGTTVTWTSDDETVATVRDGIITGKSPGVATITASVGEAESQKRTIKVEVSGIVVDTSEITVMENAEASLPTATPYGAASGVKFVSNDTYICQVISNGTKVMGYELGTTTIVVSDQNNNYKVQIPITVIADPSTTIEAADLKLGETLSFRSLSSNFRSQISGKVVSVTNLSVSTAQGTLYYNYDSEAEPGRGVGNETYYLGNVPTGQRDLLDVTFVPKPSFTGGQVTISYIAFTGEQTFNCKVVFNVVGGNSNAGGVNNIGLSTKYNTAVQFSGTEFDKICREKTGTNLDYVTFALPSERQGTLYTNYVSEGNYGTKVTLNTHYSQKNLDDVWFVPAPGFEGTVTIYYTGYAKSSAGKTYTGQIVITVGSDTASGIGGLAYNCAQGGSVTFNDVDFNDYCHDMLDSYQTLNYIRFDALPSASAGALYYDYRSTSSTGTPAAAGTAYYYGTYTPRLDRLTFVAAPDFYGTVRIPFVGVTNSGTQFSGNVEINVRGGYGAGDIHYSCAPGKTVSFNASDFTALCRSLTNRTLDYIRFQSLPSTSDGVLYHGTAKVTTSTSYRNATTGNRISSLSFHAASGFSGTVEIPFVGYASGSGESFSGVITIDSSGTSTNGDIRYSTDYKTAAVFDRDDFDDLSLWETDRAVSTVRFSLPGSSQGTLYQNYRSSSSMGTKITSSTTTISASGLDRVAFVPVSGYTGTVYLDFTAKAANNEEFTGTVQITVDRPAPDVTVRYSTRTAPVSFRSGDFGKSGSTLSSIQFTSMPPTNTGYLYYQYTSPTRYGRQAATGTTYRVSGSNLISDLTFVPRAGYSGTVTIPYTGTNSSGTTFEGEVVVTISPSTSSAYFYDMTSYTDAQRAAVDYLRENGITNGISATQYGPEYSITRADFAVMLYQAFGLTPSGSYGAFNDVPSNTYYTQAVNTLYSMGIVSGIGNGAYGTNYSVSRQDAICMVQRTMRAVGWSANDGYSSYLSSFSDGSNVSSYAQGAMAFAVQMGYLPTSGGRLAAKEPLTRVDMAQIIHRVLTY